MSHERPNRWEQIQQEVREIFSDTPPRTPVTDVVREILAQPPQTAQPPRLGRGALRRADQALHETLTQPVDVPPALPSTAAGEDEEPEEPAVGAASAAADQNGAIRRIRATMRGAHTVIHETWAQPHPGARQFGPELEDAEDALFEREAREEPEQSPHAHPVRRVIVRREDVLHGAGEETQDSTPSEEKKGFRAKAERVLKKMDAVLDSRLGEAVLEFGAVVLERRMHKKDQETASKGDTHRQHRRKPHLSPTQHHFLKRIGLGGYAETALLLLLDSHSHVTGYTIGDALVGLAAYKDWRRSRQQHRPEQVRAAYRKRAKALAIAAGIPGIPGSVFKPAIEATFPVEEEEE